MSITQTETLLCDPRTAGEMLLYHLVAQQGWWALLANLQSVPVYPLLFIKLIYSTMLQGAGPDVPLHKHPDLNLPLSLTHPLPLPHQFSHQLCQHMAGHMHHGVVYKTEVG